MVPDASITSAAHTSWGNNSISVQCEEDVSARYSSRIGYAFMGQDPDAADNRWLRDAYSNRIPIIYFLGVSPGRYTAVIPAFIDNWDAKTLKAQVSGMQSRVCSRSRMSRLG